MDDLKRRIEDFGGELSQALDKLKIKALRQNRDELRLATQAPDFWSDNLAAQEKMKQLARLEARTEPWLKLQTLYDDVRELAETGDGSLQADLEKQLEDMAAEFDRLKGELKFAGPFDDHDVLLSIHAGAGGTDAQDWAQMLLRMYVRWAEQNGLEVRTIDESAGEEAGLKSVTLELDGSFAYGRLKGEHGVHRLVRLSPFNADNLRQTSFAKVEVLPKMDQPADLVIDDKDLKVDVYRAGGHGGQSVNTTDSAVRITHLPTGISVAIQNERSQLQNKETALTILRSKLVQLQLEQHAEKLEAIKGPNQQAEWGNQIRSYVLHPYTMVKDLRTRHETSDALGVLDGDLNPFIDAYLESILGDQTAG